MRMRKLHGALAAALTAVLAVGLSAGTARAQNLDIDELAAALALPVITGDQGINALKGSDGDMVITNQSAVTLITITNGKADAVRLKVDVISGDVASTPGGPDNWQSQSFDCDLTGRETTTFVFMPLGGTPVPAPGSGISVMYAECSNLLTNNTAGNPVAAFRILQNGVFFVAVADPVSGAVISEDIIFGDAVVVDFQQGQAYSFEAISFQGPGMNDGNKVYHFDNVEYAKFPAVLATNFIAPSNGADQAIVAELILITLDGTAGNVPVPRARLGGIAYNDDEQFFDFQWEFDCFDVASLVDIDPNFIFLDGGVLGLGSMSGHLQLVPQPIATANDAHDAQYGDGNNVRRRAVHGWIVQHVKDGEDIVESNQPIQGTPDVQVDNGPAAWGRPLAQSTTALVPFLTDLDATLDVDPLN
jgi:hypothetical protein